MVGEDGDEMNDGESRKGSPEKQSRWFPERRGGQHAESAALVQFGTGGK